VIISAAELLLLLASSSFRRDFSHVIQRRFSLSVISTPIRKSHQSNPCDHGDQMSLKKSPKM
jgi:hypothetical protein